MKTINFKQFKMFLDITQEKTQTVDVSRDLADTIYKNANGILAHDLAFRIYRSEGPLELTDEEFSFLSGFLGSSTPIFQDSFAANIQSND